MLVKAKMSMVSIRQLLGLDRALVASRTNLKGIKYEKNIYN